MGAAKDGAESIVLVLAQAKGCSKLSRFFGNISIGAGKLFGLAAVRVGFSHCFAFRHFGLSGGPASYH